MAGFKKIGDENAIPVATEITDGDLLIGFDVETNKTKHFQATDLKGQAGEQGLQGDQGIRGIPGPLDGTLAIDSEGNLIYQT